MTKWAIGIGCWLAACLPALGQAIIYDNASTVPGLTSPIGIVTHPGGGFGGADASVVAPPDSVIGAGFASGFRLADDFVVPAGQVWTVTAAHVFGFSTNAATPPTTAGAFRILAGAPNAGGAVLAGDTGTNVLTSAAFTNIYRTGSASPTSGTRRVVDNVLTLATPLVLTPGTYWAEWGMTGLSFSPLLSVPGVAAVTGNAMQFNGSTLVYADAVDPNSGFAKGVPFQLVGTAAVPEPASLALAGVAVAAGLARRRRR